MWCTLLYLTLTWLTATGSCTNVTPSCAVRRRRSSSSSICSLSMLLTTSALPVSSPPSVSFPSATHNLWPLATHSNAFLEQKKRFKTRSFRWLETAYSEILLLNMSHINVYFYELYIYTHTYKRILELKLCVSSISMKRGHVVVYNEVVLFIMAWHNIKLLESSSALLHHLLKPYSKNVSYFIHRATDQ